MNPTETPRLHATTVLGVIHNGQAALGADGQATLGSTVMKSNVRKVRFLADQKLMAGFAGGTADAFTLIERFEEKLAKHGRNLRRAAIELARDWRTDRYLRRLEAMLIVMGADDGVLISGTGDVIEPEDRIFAIGSGSMYALAAARALVQHAPHLSAEQIVRESLTIAADICIYTNHRHEVLTLGPAAP